MITTALITLLAEHRAMAAAITRTPPAQTKEAPESNYALNIRMIRNDRNEKNGNK